MTIRAQTWPASFSPSQRSAPSAELSAATSPATAPTAQAVVPSSPANEAQPLLRSQLRRLLEDVVIAHERDLRVDDLLLRARLRGASAVARAAGLPVEHVLITLKQEWYAGTDHRRLPPAEATCLLARVVTLCIHAYYDAVRPH